MESSEGAIERIMKEFCRCDFQATKLFYEEDVPDKPPHYNPHEFEVWVVEKVSGGGGAPKFDSGLGTWKWCSVGEIEEFYRAGRIAPKHQGIIEKYLNEVFGAELNWIEKRS